MPTPFHGGTRCPNGPVGVSDSGLGGASVLREALRLLPNENYIYYGDSGNAPYGDKSDDITALTMACIDEADGHGREGHTDRLQHRNRGFRIQGTAAHESILHAHHKHRTCHKACLRSSGTGKVFMMATLATTRLNRYLALQARMPDPSRVINIPCPGIVERVEAGIFDDDAYDDLFDKYFAPYASTKSTP